MSNFKVFLKKYCLQIISSLILIFSISWGLIWYFKPSCFFKQNEANNISPIEENISSSQTNSKSLPIEKTNSANNSESQKISKPLNDDKKDENNHLPIERNYQLIPNLSNKIKREEMEQHIQSSNSQEIIFYLNLSELQDDSSVHLIKEINADENPKPKKIRELLPKQQSQNTNIAKLKFKLDQNKFFSNKKNLYLELVNENGNKINDGCVNLQSVKEIELKTTNLKLYKNEKCNEECSLINT